jgi:hypothetical protein
MIANKKRLSKFNHLKYGISLSLLPTIANAQEIIQIPFLDTIWATLTQYALPIIMGIGLIGAFIADRQDSETGKGILLTVAGLALAFKIVMAFLAWIKGAGASI